MKTFFFTMTLLVTQMASAQVLTHWNEVQRTYHMGINGNYRCTPLRCQEGTPAMKTVNCSNLNDMTFSLSRPYKSDNTNGYIWISYNADGPTTADWMNSRDFIIEGIFDIRGFKNTGIFKDPQFGSKRTFDVKSMSVEMLPPDGQYAKAIVDMGGSSPVQVDLKCCAPGYECRQDALADGQ